MEKEQALQALLDQVVRQGDFIGVSALYLRDGKQLAYAQAGMADRERGIPFARDTICRVFSMSKPITAFAVMKLWENGKLDLDAPVAAYLPEFGDAEHTDLTIRQLLCMTSGYGYNDNDSVQSAGLGRLYDEISESFTKGGQRTTRQVIAEMAKLPLLYRPGKGWRYGASADILAAAVEAASGVNYRDFLKQNLLDPLEMVDTDFYVPEAKRGRFAQAYDFNSGAAVPNVVNRLGIQMNMKSLPEFLSGGAGMVSTIDDYAHFATMLMNGGEWNGCRLLKPETVQAMAEPLLNAEQRKDFCGAGYHAPWYELWPFDECLRCPGGKPGAAAPGGIRLGWLAGNPVHQRPCNPQQPADDAAAQRPLGQTGQPARWRKENFVGMRGMMAWRHTARTVIKYRN